jgi:hypothetical protein
MAVVSESVILRITYEEIRTPAQQTQGRSLRCGPYQATWRRQTVLCGPAQRQLVESAKLQSLTNEGPLVAID